MRVAVGSKNPVKARAVNRAFSLYFPVVEVISIEVDSGVSNQPYNEEIKVGAENRARNALNATDAEFGNGLEGGIVEIYGTAYIAGYCAIMNQYHECHGSWGSLWECPALVVKELEAKNENGKELGDIIDELTKRKNTKQTEGAIGIFSKGVILRELAFRYTVIGALIPFLNERFYRTS